MRRKDREITDKTQIDEIIKKCSCCRLAFSTEDVPYIVPLNFGFTIAENKRILYFHGASEGRKVELAKKGGYAAFEMDTNHKAVIAEGKPCSYTFLFSSIIGKGRISIVEDIAEKTDALKIITKHINADECGEIALEMVNRTAVIKLEITELSCKQHI